MTLPFTREGSQVQSLSRPPFQRHRQYTEIVTENGNLAAVSNAFPNPANRQILANASGTWKAHPCEIRAVCPRFVPPVRVQPRR